MILIVGFLIFVYSIILHEIAHGWAAERLGDPTAKISGRLNLDPRPHIDLLWSIIFPLMLILSGSPIVFGSAKPVPIDPYNLRNPRKDLGLIGLAGPATNLVLAIIFSILARFVLTLSPTAYLSPVNQILANAVFLNIALAIFNLIPLPPLDGSRVLAAVLPDKYARELESLERFGFLIIALFLLFPTSFFSLPIIISKISNLIFNLIFPVSKLI